MTDAPAVAIVGMSGRFPGARDIAEFWENLYGGVCSISDFDEAELLAAGVDPDELRRPDYVRSKGVLRDADRFEAELFGFNRTEAAALDPQHRLLLETAWAALEDAGHNPRSAPARTGVYVGGSLTEHLIAAHAGRSPAELGAVQLRILTDREFLAPWVSYRLALEGPSLTVQSACSTSLTAVHLAAQALLLGECDTALAGGVSIDSVHRRGYVYQEGGIFSPDGRCRPFDEKAAGTVGGNGVGVVVLRRLEDALADGDPIRAVVRGSAVTNDGAAKVGFTAPSVDRQAAAITEAWSAAGLDPVDAQYLEMHGTATQLGDRIEVAAVNAAFGPGAAPGHCGIGSVKSNIGHLDAAAGVAGLIKVVMMMESGTLVPTANVTGPHPELGLETGPFRLVAAVEPWQRPAGGTRLAGVTGVGIGGTNVHLVIEEAPAAQPVPTAPEPAGSAPGEPVLLPLSARTPEGLAATARRLAAVLRSPRPPALGDVEHTLRTGRAPLDCRAALVAASTAQAADALDALAEGRTVPDALGASGAALRPPGAAWVRGEEVTWPAPSPGARRVHLPTYPFAGERRGAFSLATTTPVDRGPAAPAGPEQSGPSAAPSEPGSAPVTEEAVTGLLFTTLGLERTSDLDETYFAAGGDSLAAIHIVGRLRDDFGFDVPIELFFEQLTLRELAARIVESTHDDDGEDSLLESFLDDIESQG